MIRLFKDIRGFMRALKENNTSSFAAAAAFFMFLSLIPIVVLFCSILPYTRVSFDLVEEIGVQIVPKDFASLITEVAHEFSGGSAAAISLTALIMLWIAGKGVFALINGLNAVHGVIEKRNWVVLRIKSSFYTIILIFMIIFSLVILVLGTRINELLVTYIPDFHIVIRVMLHFRFAFVWAFLTLIFQILYTILPSTKLRYKEQFPGALFVSVCWSGLSWAFSAYINRFHGFALYGSFAAIMIAMFWLYSCMYIIFVGAQINLYFRPLFAKLAKKGSEHLPGRRRKKK